MSGAASTEAETAKAAAAATVATAAAQATATEQAAAALAAAKAEAEATRGQAAAAIAELAIREKQLTLMQCGAHPTCFCPPFVFFSYLCRDRITRANEPIDGDKGRR